MKILLFLSDLMIPLIIFYIVGFGLLMKSNVYQDFVDGAKGGLKTVAKILPTLIGLMTGVGILRASGFLDMLASLLGNVTDRIGFPSQLVPISLVKMFSSSAASGLLLDIYKQYGTDSRAGLIASLLLSSTETIFYTMSIYFVAAKVTKTRYTLAGALLATLGGDGGKCGVGEFDVREAENRGIYRNGFPPLLYRYFQQFLHSFFQFSFNGFQVLLRKIQPGMPLKTESDHPAQLFLLSDPHDFRANLFVRNIIRI